MKILVKKLVATDELLAETNRVEIETHSGAVFNIIETPDGSIIIRSNCHRLAIKPQAGNSIELNEVMD